MVPGWKQLYEPLDQGLQTETPGGLGEPGLTGGDEAGCKEFAAVYLSLDSSFDRDLGTKEHFSTVGKTTL